VFFTFSVGVFDNHGSLFFGLNCSTSGNVDAISVSRTVICALWRNKDRRRGASIEGAVSTDVIFNANSRCELSEWVSGVWAPSTLKSTTCSFSQTIRTIEDSSKILARQRRWVDGNVASRSIVFNSSNVVRFADASVVDARTMSRTVFSVVEARWNNEGAFVKSGSWALTILSAGSIGEGQVGSSWNSRIWAPSACEVQVVSNTFVAISLVQGRELEAVRRRWGKSADFNGSSRTN